jgi:FKBP-type peptidyl-prolyl cis-trans isomerase FkpA
MKHFLTFLLLNLFCLGAFCQNNNSKDLYTVPDSIKAIGFYAEVKIADDGKIYRLIPGINVDQYSVDFGYDLKYRKIEFNFPDKKKKAIVLGAGVYRRDAGYKWIYPWKENESYPLLIATASDSAAHKTLYSGYIFLPEEKKWKLIATYSNDDTTTIKNISTGNEKNAPVAYSNRWLQRSNGTWKALDSQTTKPPSLRQMSNIDSLAQQKMEEDLLRSKLPKDSIVYEEGMFYQTIKEGTGRFVKVTDTLTVHYRGSLFGDGSVFDQTRDKPATFPLERLIKGWQLGLVHCKVGGKMRLYLPSGSAYGIRTRSATIPPNSILVFDVEVLDAKEKIAK